MYVRNHITVPEFGWYFRIKIGCGTGKRPTKVPCCKNLMISLSSVRPRSIQIFSTCGTKTCNRRIIVCNGNFPFHDWTHSEVGDQRARSVCWPKLNVVVSDWRKTNENVRFIQRFNLLGWASLRPRQLYSNVLVDFRRDSKKPLKCVQSFCESLQEK